jgi:membrane-associated phospholipid phosphatase
VLLIGLPVSLWLSRNRPALADVACRLLLVYASCAVCYLIFPVIGPAPLPPVADAVRHGAFFDFSAAIQRAGDSLGTSLPSTHAAGSMTLALAAWRWLPRPIAVAILAQAVGIACSTVYTQNHYAIDAAAGILLAAALHMVMMLLSGDREPLVEQLEDRGQRFVLLLDGRQVGNRPWRGEVGRHADLRPPRGAGIPRGADFLDEVHGVSAQ